jgi:dienelactone hydrolase
LLAAAAVPATLVGAWAGVVTGGARSLYATFVFTATSGGAISATVAYPRESEQTFPVASVSFRDGQLRLQMFKGRDPIALGGGWRSDRISGISRYGSATGTFELLPLRKLARADLLPYTGDFSDGRGHDVVISESLGVLYFLDLTSGRTGRLYPLSEDTFFGGPTRLIFAPVAVTAAFANGASGSFETLQLTIDGVTSALHRATVGSLQDVSFQAPDAQIAGTLRRPRGQGPFPAILVLAGSNGQPRTGYYSIEDFVADHFLRLGFIVLTFDKRGAGESTGLDNDNGVELVAAAAFRFLAAEPDVDANRLGIWGMSQGGIIAPKIATLDRGVRFIINVSGSVVDANTEEIERTASMLRADGFDESAIAQAVAFQRLKFRYASSGEGWDEYIKAYERYKNAAWFPDPYVGPPDSKSSTAWKFWRESGAIHPFDYWRTYTGSVLLLYGQHDTIGDPNENAELFVKAMREAKNESYTISVLPDADHSMYLSSTGSMREERLLTTFDLDALAAIDGWLRSRRLIK